MQITLSDNGLRGQAMNERDVLLAAIEIDDPARRAAYVEQTCGSDAGLRAQVEELLKTHEQTSHFLETPAAATDSSVDQAILTNPSDTDDAPHSGRLSGEAELRRYLEPATRPGWLGRLAHYEIEEILGRGAFGIVAKAFDEKLHRVVAIKLLNPELASTSPPRKRFLREARTAAAVTHENIVAIHAVEEEPLPYLVLEYIPGITLQQRMNEHGPLEVPEVLRIGHQVAAGLAAAHAVNLIHRDIKPSNILLSAGPHERAKISDFGLARAVDDASLTSSGLIAGTPLYMAPEQALGDTLDHRADLFSLGSVLYQMASGRPPFRASNTVAVLKRVCEDTPRPVDDVIPGTPAWLETIIFRLLEKERDNRYQTVQEVADLLARCQSELEHNGQVTCVAGRHETAETLDFQPKTATRSGPRKKEISWLVGGVIAIAAMIGLLLNGGRQATDSGVANTSATTTTGSNTGTPGDAIGWPADAPPPAIAPFHAGQAQAHQAAWAKYLGVPVEYENSIGMKLRLIPPGEFLMGSTPEEIEAALRFAGEDQVWRERINRKAPLHRVILTQPVYAGVTEVTQAQYEQVMGTNPSYYSASGQGKDAVTGLETGNYPVESVSWNDAAEFCAKLSQQEQLEPFDSRSTETVTALGVTGYRLPTEAEWEHACRAGTTMRFWSGDEDSDLLRAGWFLGNSGGRTHAVRELTANPFGLSDVHGNVWEWVQDGWDPAYYSRFIENAAVDPQGSSSGISYRVKRGGCWGSSAWSCRAAKRFTNLPDTRNLCMGFRVVMTVAAVKQQQSEKRTTPSVAEATGWHGWPADAPPPAIAPFDAGQAQAHQAAWAKYLGVPVEYENSIGMKLRLIPPGEFTMGGTLEEVEATLEREGKYQTRRVWIKSATPQHKVILTLPVYVGVTEVTQAQYELVMGTNPSHFSATGRGKKAVAGLETANHPVETVSWNDAAEFCTKLSQQERLKPFYFRSGQTATLLEGTGYRLPTEAEWEFACRAGTTTRFWSGNQDNDLLSAGWFWLNSGLRTHTVGKLRANPFGLFDVHGNVWNWVQDSWVRASYSTFSETAAIDPYSPFTAGFQRVARGGGFNYHSLGCSSSYRGVIGSTTRSSGIGCRVVQVVDSSRISLP